MASLQSYSNDSCIWAGKPPILNKTPWDESYSSNRVSDENQQLCRNDDYNEEREGGGTLVPDQLEQVGGPSSGVRFDTDIYYLQFPMYIIQNVLYLGVRV